MKYVFIIIMVIISNPLYAWVIDSTNLNDNPILLVVEPCNEYEQLIAYNANALCNNASNHTALWKTQEKSRYISHPLWVSHYARNDEIYYMTSNGCLVGVTRNGYEIINIDLKKYLTLTEQTVKLTDQLWSRQLLSLADNKILFGMTSTNPQLLFAFDIYSRKLLWAHTINCTNIGAIRLLPNRWCGVTIGQHLHMWDILTGKLLETIILPLQYSAHEMIFVDRYHQAQVDSIFMHDGLRRFMQYNLRNKQLKSHDIYGNQKIRQMMILRGNNTEIAIGLLTETQNINNNTIDSTNNNPKEYTIFSEEGKREIHIMDSIYALTTLRHGRLITHNTQSLKIWDSRTGKMVLQSPIKRIKTWKSKPDLSHAKPLVMMSQPNETERSVLVPLPEGIGIARANVDKEQLGRRTYRTVPQNVSNVLIRE